jgi:hypothetical protein
VLHVRCTRSGLAISAPNCWPLRAVRTPQNQRVPARPLKITTGREYYTFDAVLTHCRTGCSPSRPRMPSRIRSVNCRVTARVARRRPRGRRRPGHRATSGPQSNRPQPTLVRPQRGPTKIRNDWRPRNSGPPLVGDTGIEPVTPTVSTFSARRWLRWLVAMSLVTGVPLVGRVGCDGCLRSWCCTTVARSRLDATATTATQAQSAGPARSVGGRG